MSIRNKLGITVAIGLACAIQTPEADAQTTKPTIILHAFASGADDGDIGAVIDHQVRATSTTTAELLLTAIRLNKDSSKTQYHCTIQFQTQAALFSAVQLIKGHTGTTRVSCGGAWTTPVSKANKMLTTANWSMTFK